MRLGSRPCDYRCGVTIQRDQRPGSLPHPEPSRAPDLDLSLHPTLPCPAHSAIMLTVKYREMLAIACAEKSYGEFRFSSESDAWDWSAMRYVEYLQLSRPLIIPFQGHRYCQRRPVADRFKATDPLWSGFEHGLSMPLPHVEFAGVNPYRVVHGAAKDGATA